MRKLCVWWICDDDIVHYLSMAPLGCPHEGGVASLAIPGVDVKDETVSVLEQLLYGGKVPILHSQT